MKVVQQIVQNEMNQFQNRVQRCAMDCSDAIQDEYPNLSSTSPSVAKAQQKLNSCMNTCADKHIALLKGISAKIESDIDKIAK